MFKRKTKQNLESLRNDAYTSYKSDNFEDFKWYVNKIQDSQNKKNHDKVKKIIAQLLSFVVNTPRESNKYPIDMYLCELMMLRTAADVLLTSLQHILSSQLKLEEYNDQNTKDAVQAILYKEVLKAATMPSTMNVLHNTISTLKKDSERDNALNEINRVFFGNMDDESTIYYRVTTDGEGDCLLNALSMFLFLYNKTFQDTLQSLGISFEEYSKTLNIHNDDFNRYKTWYHVQTNVAPQFRKHINKEGNLEINDIQELAELFNFRVRIFGCEDFIKRNSENLFMDNFENKIDVENPKATLYLMYVTIQNPINGRSSYRTGHWELMIPSCFRGYFPIKMLAEGPIELWPWKEMITMEEKSLFFISRTGTLT